MRRRKNFAEMVGGVIVRRTPQGYEVSDIIDGHRVSNHFIGYTKKQAVAEFKKMYSRRNPKRKRNPMFNSYVIRKGYKGATRTLGWNSRKALFSGRFRSKDLTWYKTPKYPVYFQSRGNADAVADMLYESVPVRVVKVPFKPGLNVEEHERR